MSSDTSVLTRHLHLCFAISSIIPDKYNCTREFDYGLALGRKIKNSNVEKKEQFEFSGEEKLHLIELLPL